METQRIIVFALNSMCSCQRTARSRRGRGFEAPRRFGFGQNNCRLAIADCEFGIRNLQFAICNPMVGVTGLEPVTLRLSSACSNQLSYTPGAAVPHDKIV